jgi:hypothetical protein
LASATTTSVVPATLPSMMKLSAVGIDGESRFAGADEGEVGAAHGIADLPVLQRDQPLVLEPLSSLLCPTHALTS